MKIIEKHFVLIVALVIAWYYRAKLATFWDTLGNAVTAALPLPSTSATPTTSTGNTANGVPSSTVAGAVAAAQIPQGFGGGGGHAGNAGRYDGYNGPISVFTRDPVTGFSGSALLADLGAQYENSSKE